MPNNGISALMGVAGAILTLMGIYSIVFPAVNLSQTSGYGGLGYATAVMVFIGSGAVLLYFFFKRTRQQETVSHKAE